MKKIAGYLFIFLYETPKQILLLTTLFTSLLVFANYYFGINKWIIGHNQATARFLYRYLISLLAFIIPFLFFFSKRVEKKPVLSAAAVFIALLAPAIFSLKMSIPLSFPVTDNVKWNQYWNIILYWPAWLCIISSILFIFWWKFYRQDSFFGLTTKNFDWKPYVLMQLIMVPLIIIASTQPDFLHAYPKMKIIPEAIRNTPFSGIYKLLFELSYGSDFITIELFFRGFLILGFTKWAGKQAILPMACFYCTIHFGKPLGECISSYFGGILLGVITWHTRSVIGGLMIHIGIAWMMEAGGFIGNYFHGS